MCSIFSVFCNMLFCVSVFFFLELRDVQDQNICLWEGYIKERIERLREIWFWSKTKRDSIVLQVRQLKQIQS